MNSEIRLLDASLLADEEKLREISYWLRVMNRPNGWHYDLDRIWILNELEKAGVKPGATIMDAGAGQGDTQFLLAARGYNVISLDFSPRSKPPHARGVFNIVGAGDAQIEYEHPYMKFISYGTSSIISRATNFFTLSRLKKISQLPQRALRRMTSNLSYMFERFVRRHEHYGKITYLRAPFHKIPMDSESVDAIISISAIEHADINLFGQNITELSRILKPGAPLLLTTSATAANKSNYHEKTAGWCYSLSALKEYFPVADVEFDAGKSAKSILESDVFRNRLDPYYYQDKDAFCYKKRLSDLPYLPVAIKLIK